MDNQLTIATLIAVSVLAVLTLIGVHYYLIPAHMTLHPSMAAEHVSSETLLEGWRIITGQPK